MKKLLVFSLILLSLSAFAVPKVPASAIYEYPITRIIDGDTVAFNAAFLPLPLKSELSIRIWGVDTPEKTLSQAKCPAEIEKGKAASKFTATAVNAATKRQVAIMSWDKYGGRVLGDVLLDGKSLREMLITGGHARAYYGGAKASWCN
jgi:micrococcal nuclease